MKLTILDGHAVNPGDLPWDVFSQFADVTVYERTSPDKVVERIKDSDLIFLNKIQITEEILAQCPKLKYIGVLATGYNVIDLEAAKKRNIVVTNIPSYSTESVAQHTFAFILNFTNQVAYYNNSVQAGDWIKCPDFCYWNTSLLELKEKTLGIFGYGAIGKQVAHIAKAFGMNVICCSRSQKPDMPEKVSFEELMKRSDFISLHAPLTEQTNKIINKNALKLMKPTAFLINTARGGLVDETELSHFLNSKKIAGYACDVVSEEPMHEKNPLLGAKNCIITPHVAWAPFETRKRLQQIALNNLKCWLDGHPVNVVN